MFMIDKRRSFTVVAIGRWYSGKVSTMRNGSPAGGVSLGGEIVSGCGTCRPVVCVDPRGHFDCT